MTPEVQWTCRPDDTDQVCILSLSASKQIILVGLQLHFTFVVNSIALISFDGDSVLISYIYVTSIRLKMLMKANKNGKKFPRNIFICTNPAGRTEQQQQQAATVQEMYILLYTSTDTALLCHCTVHLHYRGTVQKYRQLELVQSAAQQKCQYSHCFELLISLPSSLTKSLQTSLQGKIQLLSKSLNLVKVMYFIIYQKDQDKPNYGLCFNFCDTVLNYSDLRL